MSATEARSISKRAQDFVMWRAGPAISRVGEALRIDWLIYNPLLYYSFHELAVRNAPGVMGAISEAFPRAKRYLDVGAGTGAFAAQAARMGKQVSACEYSPHGRRRAARQGVDIHPFDLTQDEPTALMGPFDLAYCFEIAEHLQPHIGDRLVAFLVRMSPLVVFTAAQPGQQGTGHINEQPRSYWIERFEAAGAKHDAAASEKLSARFAEAHVSDWFENNVSVFRRVAKTART